MTLDASRHDPVALGGGWIECRRCGAGWAEDDDEVRGRPLVCDPDAVRFGDGPEATVYRSPARVDCSTCGAPAGEPCLSLRGDGGLLRNGWHQAREHVPHEDEEDAPS